MKNIFFISGVGVLNEKNNKSIDFLKKYIYVEFFEKFISDNKLSELSIYCLKTFGIQICLSELWENWGIKPDIIVGHSFGEISACVLSGAINLFDAIDLILDMTNEIEKHDGWLYHGFNLKTTNDTYVSSINFINEEMTHLTVCGLNDSLKNFLKLNPDAKKMYVKNPWHHKIYKNNNIGAKIANKQNNIKTKLYLSSKTKLVKKLADNHWKEWMFTECNMIKIIDQINIDNPDEIFNIVELGDHPVMEQMASNLNINKYVLVSIEMLIPLTIF